jgi:hypothetical protein
VSDCKLDEQRTFRENALTLIVDDEGNVSYGVRLDAATGLPSLDAVVEPAPTPDDGWPNGTIMVDERPLLPLDRASRAARQSTRRCVAPGRRPVAARGPRRGPSRARRSRPARQTRTASRDGPSDEDGGDGEGPPSPTPVSQRQRSSNSQSGDRFCPRWEVGNHGIDTVVFGWKDAEASQALLALAHTCNVDPETGRRAQRGVWSGRSMRLELPVAGIRFGVHPATSVVTAEARLIVMLTGHCDNRRLAEPECVAAGAAFALEALKTLGVETDSPVHLRRIDLAAELIFPNAADGLIFLRACERGLLLPRLKQVLHHAAGQARVESIEWQTPKGNQTRLRLYDAGIRHETNRPGERLRLERQQRWQGQKTPRPEWLSAVDLAGLFRAPLEFVLRQPRTIEVATPSEAVALLFEKVRSGEITRRKAESLSGKISTLTWGDDLLSQHDRHRRRRDLKSAGIALDLAVESNTVIDLTPPLKALADAYGAQQGSDRRVRPGPWSLGGHQRAKP